MLKITTADLVGAHIVIWSGEGVQGTQERFKGRKTVRAIQSKLKREMSGGDRWAYAIIQLKGDNYQYQMSPGGIMCY